MRRYDRGVEKSQNREEAAICDALRGCPLAARLRSVMSPKFTFPAPAHRICGNQEDDINERDPCIPLEQQTAIGRGRGNVLAWAADPEPPRAGRCTRWLKVPAVCLLATAVAATLGSSLRLPHVGLGREGAWPYDASRGHVCPGWPEIREGLEVYASNARQAIEATVREEEESDTDDSYFFSQNFRYITEAYELPFSFELLRELFERLFLK